MKKKLVSAMLVSSTIATNVVSSSTVVLANELGQEPSNEVSLTEDTNSEVENQNSSQSDLDEAEKPEINYEEETEKVEEESNVETSVETEEDITEKDGTEEDSVQTEDVVEATAKVASEINDGPAVYSNEIFAVKHSIMGQSEVTKGGFKEFFRVMANKMGFTYKLNCTIDEFVDLAYEEAAIEGVRADITIAQAVWETGYFQYGGIVSPNDNNYAGIGAVGTAGVKESFESPRIGLRAQIQHLKAYGSTDALKQACVDPRFKYVTRGSAPSVEELAGKWAVPGYDTKKYSSLAEAAAANDSYGQLIYGVIEQAKQYNGTPDNGGSSNNGGNTGNSNNNGNAGDNNNGGNTGNSGSEDTNTTPETPTLISKGQVVNVTSALNVRESASSSARVVTTLKPNQNVNIYGESNGWYKVDYVQGGVTKYGYCSKDYISVQNEVTPPTQPETTPPTPPAIIPPESSATKIGVVSTSSGALNIRSGAGTNYSVVTTIAKGKEVEITGESGSWYKINYNGQSGYVSKDYITIKSNWTTENKPSTSYKKGTVINVSTSLNVRTGASTSSSVVGYLLNGTVVQVTGETNGWYKIIFSSTVGDKEGYVSGQYLKVE